MPTSFDAHLAYPAAFSTTTGRNAHLFQPPKSPAPTTSSPSFASTNDYFSPRSKKRQRADSPHSNDVQQTPWTATPGWVQCPTPSDGMYRSAAAHNSALVNERYRLAGGYDTPGLMAAAEQEQSSAGSGDYEFRRRVRDMDQFGREHIGAVPMNGALARERNGVARLPSSPNGAENKSDWTNFAFNLVGRVFTFGTSVFKGFYAGGGKGYDFQEQQHSLSDSWMHQPRGGQTPVPGSWREDEFLGDFEQDNPTYSPSIAHTRPPNKRRQTDKDSWVMVGTPDGADLSPKRKQSIGSVAWSSLGATRPSASRANSRRSLAPVSRRQSYNVTYTGSPAHPPLLPDRRTSFAPMRSPGSRPGSGGVRPSSAGVRSSSAGVRPSSTSATTRPNTPPLPSNLSPSTSKLLKQQAKQGKGADKTMNHMNRQLRDLIQQAQVALGTRYSVEVEGVDAAAGGEDYDERGFVDEEW